jgi:hypothetical protein
MRPHTVLLGHAKELIFWTAGRATRAILSFLFVSAALASPPEFVFSTFLGGATDDELAAVACDVSGNIYVAGITRAMSNPPWAQMLVAKYSIQGSVVWTRTIDFGDRLGPVAGAAVTADGRLCVVGWALLPSSGPPARILGRRWR